MISLLLGGLQKITGHFGAWGQGDDVPLLTPPQSFVDAAGREIRLRAYDGDGVESLVGMYVDFDPTQRAQGMPPVGEGSVREWLDTVLNGLSVLAWHEERVVGHVMFVPGDEKLHELAIFVHQTYQRARVGSNLIRTGLGHAQQQDVEKVWLSVERRKRGAQKLYRRMGFTVTDPRGLAFRMSRRL